MLYLAPMRGMNDPGSVGGSEVVGLEAAVTPTTLPTLSTRVARANNRTYLSDFSEYF